VRGNFVESVQIGTGINVESLPDVKPDAFVPAVASIEQYGQIPLGKVFVEFIHQLYANYELYLAGFYDRLWQHYIDRSAVIGRRVNVYSDPYEGPVELICSGVVERIGKNLELYFAGLTDPVNRGRVVIVEDR
jgi:biotin-(acetyl-CoA carboxylase) ligase